MKYENTFKAIDQKLFPYLKDFQNTDGKMKETQKVWKSK
jgi:hypothetical protein